RTAKSSASWRRSVLPVSGASAWSPSFPRVLREARCGAIVASLRVARSRMIAAWRLAKGRIEARAPANLDRARGRSPARGDGGDCLRRPLRLSRRATVARKDPAAPGRSARRVYGGDDRRRRAGRALAFGTAGSPRRENGAAASSRRAREAEREQAA